MILLSVFLALLLPSSAAATDWNGMWLGSGVFSDNVAEPETCETLAIGIGFSGGSLELYSQGICESQAWEETLVFDVIRDELRRDGFTVGSITEDHLQFTLIQSRWDRSYSLHLMHAGDGGLEFSEKLRQRAYESRIEGKLSPL